MPDIQIPDTLTRMRAMGHLCIVTPHEAGKYGVCNSTAFLNVMAPPWCPECS